MLLEVKDLVVGYGGMQALHGVNICVAQGECVAIIGPNGAGKSTLLKAIAGVLKPMRGDILFAGKSIAGMEPEQLIHQAIVFVPQGKRVFPSLTVSENIEVMLEKFAKRERKRLIEEVLELFPILRERSSVLAGRLSGGEQQVVALARALTVKPKLLLLDEPSHGLSPRWTNEIFRRLSELAQKHITVVLVEQNVRKACVLADRAYILKMGQVARESHAKELTDTIAVDWGFTVRS